MTRGQLRRRQQAIDRHYAALDRWPDRQGEPFTEELTITVAELEELAGEMDATGNPLERSRTWRFLGDAYFDLARGKDVALLQMGRRAYGQAEGLLEGQDEPLERAKLDFNLANTLRGLGQGTDRSLLEEAKLRYQLAMETFRHKQPQYVEQVTQILGTLEVQLSLLGLYEQAAEKVTQLKEIQQTLTRGGTGITIESEQAARRMFKEFQVGGPGTSAIQRKVEEILDSLKIQFSGPGGTQVTDLVGYVESLKHQFTTAISIERADRQPERGLAKRLFGLLMERVRLDIDQGKVSAIRQRALRSLLAGLEDLLDQMPEETSEIMAWLGENRELMARVIPLMSEPSHGKALPPSSSRAAVLLDYLSGLRSSISGELARSNRSAAERKTGQELFVRLATIESDLIELGEKEVATRSLERDLMRQLSLEVHQYAHREHMILAYPIWPSPPVVRDPNMVFFSGAVHVRESLGAACSRRSLTLAAETKGRNVEQARWDDLRRSNLAVFDLTVEAGPQLAAVCFELGIAKALGRPTVILVEPNKPTPFDVDKEPYALSGRSVDQDIIGDAIDSVMYQSPQREADSSIADTVAFAKQRWGSDTASFEVKHILQLLERETRDPIEVRRSLESLSGFLGSKAPQLLYPAWPGSYPELGGKRCFHVMPFRPNWANEIMQIVEKACRETGVHYVRGDKAKDIRIIRSIWDEICLASHVLVDLTGFTPNVALELGLSLTLGRNTLIVGQGDIANHLFPSISKLRVHPYDLNGEAKSLSQVVGEWFSPQRVPP